MTAKRYINKLEAKEARKRSGRKTPVSGAFFGADYQIGEWNVEMKNTRNSSFSVTAKDINKGMTRAFQEGKRFAMQIAMNGATVWVIPSVEVIADKNGVKIE